MDANRFDALSRTIEIRSRRIVLGALSGAAALSPLTFRSDAAAKKCKRKKKHKKPSPPTCAESCPSNCVYCFIRPGAPTLCGDGLSINCSSTCTSDQGCIGTMQPYCASQYVNRMTGEVKDVGTVFGITDPCCISIVDCL
jgi:hypothetical protein